MVWSVYVGWHIEEPVNLVVKASWLAPKTQSLRLLLQYALLRVEM